MKSGISRRVRIDDVARHAEVSATAVSFAFNNPHRLNPQTVQRILEAAEELGYTPNPHARALLAKAIGTIGVLAPQSLPAMFSNPFFMVFNEGVGRVCEENGLSLLMVSPVTGTSLEAIAKAPVDGLIVIGFNQDNPQLDIVRKRRIPYVIVDGDAATAPSINVDDVGGAYQAAAHLLGLGHRDIAYMTFETDHVAPPDSRVYGVGQRRLKGYQQAVADYGVRCKPEWLVPASLSMAGGAEAFNHLWQANARPTAILAIADVLAFGILQAAAEQGLRVPDDLSVVGFDDNPQSAWASPPLTTVRQPALEKGELAAQTLLSIIAGELAEPSHVVMPTQLIVRSTTKAR